MRTVTTAAIAALLGGLLTAWVARPPQDAPAPGGEGPSMEDMAAMMEAYLQAAAPGEEHALLATWEGRWDLAVKHWMDPSLPPGESTATSRFEMALGGRYLIEHVEGTTPMGPFQGMGITAFDNITGQFFNVWIDSMSTGVMLARGGRPEGDVQAMTGEYPNPATGTLTGFRSQMRLEGPDRRTYTMWESRGDGEAKTMEIHYTRAQD